MSPILKRYRKTSDGDGPPHEEGRTKASARERGRMRRRLRQQQRVREALLLDLGALVFELHRQGRREPELLQAKAAELTTVDREVRALSEALDADYTVLELAAPGLLGTCASCGALMTSDARFCPSCGTPTEEPMLEAPPGLEAGADGAPEAAEPSPAETAVNDEGVAEALPEVAPEDVAEPVDAELAERSEAPPEREVEEPVHPSATAPPVEDYREEGAPSWAIPAEEPPPEPREEPAVQEPVADVTPEPLEEPEPAPAEAEAPPEAAPSFAGEDVGPPPWEAAAELEEPAPEAPASALERDEPEVAETAWERPQPPPVPPPRRPDDLMTETQRRLRTARRRARRWLDRGGPGRG